MKLQAVCLTLALATATPRLAIAADLADTAAAAGSFKTLVAAADAAGWMDTLKSDGPLTVFAPSDEAFAKLPAGTVQSLLKPENRDKLVSILTYHVVPGKVLAADVVKLSGATTVQGQQVDVKVDGTTVTVDGAKVTDVDILCDNGVIHVIDSVLMPSESTIVETAVAAGSFQTLVAAVKAAGFVETLSGTGPLTVLAPTDEAFAKLPAGTVENLLKPENKAMLTRILTYHVVPGRVYSGDAIAAKSATTLEGSSVDVRVIDGVASINDAKLISTDLDASNGVIHVIDTVLMPPAKGASARQQIRDAIAQGSSLFNAGHHGQCADLYHATMHSLMSSEINASVQHHLTSVMDHASSQSCPTTRAWTLRRGLDQAYAQLRSN